MSLVFATIVSEISPACVSLKPNPSKYALMNTTRSSFGMGSSAIEAIEVCDGTLRKRSDAAFSESYSSTSGVPLRVPPKVSPFGSNPTFLKTSPAVYTPSSANIATYQGHPSSVTSWATEASILAGAAFNAEKGRVS